MIVQRAPTHQVAQEHHQYQAISLSDGLFDHIWLCKLYSAYQDSLLHAYQWDMTIGPSLFEKGQSAHLEADEFTRDASSIEPLMSLWTVEVSVEGRKPVMMVELAPVRIDEAIEVHLRDGVDSQVDFFVWRSFASVLSAQLVCKVSSVRLLVIILCTLFTLIQHTSLIIIWFTCTFSHSLVYSSGCEVCNMDLSRNHATDWTLLELFADVACVPKLVAQFGSSWLISPDLSSWNQPSHHSKPVTSSPQS